MHFSPRALTLLSRQILKITQRILREKLTHAVVSMFREDDESSEFLRVLPDETGGVYVEGHVGFVTEVEEHGTAGSVVLGVDEVTLLVGSGRRGEVVDLLLEEVLGAVYDHARSVQRNGVTFLSSRRECRANGVTEGYMEEERE